MNFLILDLIFFLVIIKQLPKFVKGQIVVYNDYGFVILQRNWITIIHWLMFSSKIRRKKMIIIQKKIMAARRKKITASNANGYLSKY